jgi:hypothetical protein
MIFFPGILSYFVSISAKSLIIPYQYNIESVYFFYSNPVLYLPPRIILDLICILDFLS